MNLQKINSKDLIFSNDLGNDRTNTYLQLNDYDWMDYRLSTHFKTKEMGIINVKFQYFGMVTSIMEVTQILNKKTNKVTYEFSTDIFKKHIVNFLEKHISSWNDLYAFNGEEEVITFFNDVLENGIIKKNEN